MTAGPIGVNLFVPGREAAPEPVTEYAAVAATAAEAGVELGTARSDDDAWEPKLALLLDDPPAALSFTFGCPDSSVVSAIHAAGSEAWVTVTTPDEAEHAAEVGADVLIAQGAEAGGHRGSRRSRSGQRPGRPDIRTGQRAARGRDCRSARQRGAHGASGCSGPAVARLTGGQASGDARRSLA
jgi:nitronate monooxygenase